MAGTFSNIATVSDYNSDFMKNNPQYGYFTGMKGGVSLPGGVTFGGNPTYSSPSAPKPGMTSYVDPNTPTKSQILGSKVYGNGSTQSAPSPAPKTSYTGGQSMPAIGTPEYVKSQTTTPNTLVGDSPNPSSNSPFINAVNTQQTYSSGAGTPAVNASVGRLQGISQDQTPAVKEALKEYQDVYKNPYMIDALSNSGMAESVSAGAGQRFAQNYNALLSGANQNVSNVLGGQGQQIQAANEAGGLAQGQTSQQQSSAANVGSLTQPQAGASYFGSPVTGETVGTGVGGSSLVQTGVTQAVQQALSGGDPAALRSQLLSQYGAPAAQAFDQAMLNRGGGKYNPTAASASSQQTASQAAATGGAAFQLDTALKQVDTIAPVISSFLTESGINSTDNPLYNEQINKYIQDIKNPAAVAQFQLMMNDLQKFSSQILAQGSGGTPTMAAIATELQDPSKLSVSQINDYLTSLKTLGGNQLSVLQNQAQASGFTGYSGQQSTPSASVPVASQASTGPGVKEAGSINDTLGQVGSGAFLNTTGGIIGGASGILKWLSEL